MKVKVGVSNRHIHISREDFVKLCGEEHDFYSVRDLSQGGEFSSNVLVDVKTSKNVIRNVRIVGPFRDKTQIELSITDSYFLGINPPVRMSGDFDGAEDATLVYNDREVFVKGAVIVPNRHIHANREELEKYNLHEGEVLSVRVNGDRGGILDNVIVKCKDSYSFELHLDTDEANAFNLKNGDVIDIIER